MPSEPIEVAQQMVRSLAQAVRKHASLIVAFYVRCHNVGMSVSMTHYVIWLFGKL